jgi:hypothetical protein
MSDVCQCNISCGNIECPRNEVHVWPAEISLTEFNNMDKDCRDRFLESGGKIKRRDG